MPVGWAWAMDAPFQWTKQVASHFGGTRNPMVVHWPKGIKAKGEMRTQFHHVIDVVPTILEACKIPEPKVGERHSAEADRRRVDALLLRRRQGEGPADDAVLRNGDQPGDLPRRLGGVQPVRAALGHGRSRGCFMTAPWELYNVDEDFSQADDLAAKDPAKLKELQAKFLEEAKKYDVFPLDPRFSERIDPKLRIAGEPPTSWTYYGNNVWLPEPIGPQLFPRAHTITAELVIPKGGPKASSPARVRSRRAGRSTSRTASRTSATRSSTSPT